MSINMFILQNHLPENEQHWVERCKSTAMETGWRLREAHTVLGNHIARYIHQQHSGHSHGFAVAILMRAGLPFGMGIADELEKLGHDVAIYFIHDNHDKWITEIGQKTLIVADAVINSGNSIQSIMQKMPYPIQKSMIIATTVMPMNAVAHLESWNIMTVRLSHHHYQGAKIHHIENGRGPDTGDRLFGTL